MQNQLDLYVSIIYLLAAVPYVWLGLYAWRKRPAVAVTPFAWAMLGMSIWSFGYSLEIFFPSLPIKLFITKIEYIGIVSIPVFLLFFSLEFTGNSHLLPLRTRFLLWSIPFTILILVWTNESHHLMWDMETITETGGLKLLDIRYGLFFWVQLIFSYLLVIFASILLIMEMIQRPRIYRIQISFVVLGILFPWVGSLIFVGKLNPIPNLDITPLLFLPTGLGLSWAILRFRLLEVLPLEHLNVLKNMKDGVIVLNPSQRILYINPIAEKILGCSENDVIGQPLASVSKIYAKKLMPYLSGAEQQAEIMIGEGGQATVYEATVSPVASRQSSQASSGPDSIITLHDITERKELENTLGKREAIMSAISLTAEQFLKESAWERNVPAVLAKIGQSVDVSRIYVVMNYTDEKNILYSSLCYEWAAPDVAAQIDNDRLRHIHLQQAGFDRWEKELSQNKPIHGLTEEFPASEQKLFKAQGSISIAAMPIFVENQWWGFIMFDECRNKRHWINLELKALRTIANIFGSAESRSRAEQKLIQRQRSLDLLHEIVTISLQAESAKDMAQTVVDRLGELIKADGCFLSLWDENNKRTIPFAAYSPFQDTYEALSPQPGELTFTESVLELGRPLIIEDTRTTSYADPRIVKNFPSISILVLPLMVMNKKLGSVILSFDSPHRFLPEEISISEQACALIALALEKFQAVEQAQKRADTSETLRKASAAIAEKLEIEAAVTHILEQLNQVIPYDSASVQLLDGNELQIIGGRGWDNPSDIIGVRFTIPGDNPNSIVIETRKPYILAETRNAHEAFSKPPHDHIHSWLGVPLIVQDRIIGLLAIDSAKPNHFIEADITVASTFADQVAVTLEHARIFKETQDQAITDPLTGVYNRRGLFELARVDFLRSISLDRPFSVVMIDLDRFKQINDTYGHAVGDQVLHEFAKRCKSCVREIDYVGRYGGEEFIIMLPETSMDTSLIVAERLRATIAGNPMQVGEGLELNITASLGVAQKDENTISLEMLITRADQAMYAAKHKGRNRVEISK